MPRATAWHLGRTLLVDGISQNASVVTSSRGGQSYTTRDRTTHSRSHMTTRGLAMRERDELSLPPSLGPEVLKRSQESSPVCASDRIAQCNHVAPDALECLKRKQPGKAGSAARHPPKISYRTTGQEAASLQSGTTPGRDSKTESTQKCTVRLSQSHADPHA